MVIFHSSVNLPPGSYNVGKTILNHPPVITIFVGCMVTIPNWVVNDCFINIIKISGWWFTTFVDFSIYWKS